MAVTDPKSGVVIPFPTRGRPDRFKDRFLEVVDRWQEGCLYCGEPAEVRPLPASHGLVRLPLCDKHVRWAMACRREGAGKQSRHLRGFVLAWVRLKGGDRDAAIVWLHGHDIGPRA
jgi:hypothetical protein